MSGFTIKRKYTANEIGKMRSMCRWLLRPVGSSYRERDLASAAEDALRTYMCAGLGPDDLTQEVEKKGEEERRYWEAQGRAFDRAKVRFVEP